MTRTLPSKPSPSTPGRRQVRRTHGFCAALAIVLGIAFAATFGTAAASSGDAGTPALPAAATQPAPTEFSDVPEGHWALETVRRMVDTGIIVGFPDGTFRGGDSITRYQAAIIAARTIDYLDGILNAIADDPEFIANLQAVGRDLRGVANLTERVRRIEAGLEEAASLAYVRALEERVVALEAALNDVFGDERFPAEMQGEDAAPQSVAEALPDAAPGTNAAFAEDGVAVVLGPEGVAELEDVQTATGIDAVLEALRTDFEYPFFVGISPGVISTTGAVHFGVHFGRDAVAGPLGFAGRLVFDSVDGLRVGAGLHVRFEAIPDTLDIVPGLGLSMIVTGENGGVSLEAPFGFEYFANERVGLFAKLTPAYAFTPRMVTADFTAGVNLRF